MPRLKAPLVAAALIAGAASVTYGQTPAPLEVGDVAPDFALTAATRDGILEAPVRLEAFAGRTVVLAFFFKARTKG